MPVPRGAGFPRLWHGGGPPPRRQLVHLDQLPRIGCPKLGIIGSRRRRLPAPGGSQGLGMLPTACHPADRAAPCGDAVQKNSHEMRENRH